MNSLVELVVSQSKASGSITSVADTGMLNGQLKKMVSDDGLARHDLQPHHF